MFQVSTRDFITQLQKVVKITTVRVYTIICVKVFVRRTIIELSKTLGLSPELPLSPSNGLYIHFTMLSGSN